MGFIVPPSKWEIQHAGQIFAAQNYQAAHGGQLPDTRMWRMLEFRHDLNASRFNFYHPNIGRMIAAQGATPPPTPVQQVIDGWKGHMRGPTGDPTNPVVPPTTPIQPPPDPGGGTVVDPTPVPQVPTSVPEPASILMFAAAILVAGLGFHRFRRGPI